MLEDHLRHLALVDHSSNWRLKALRRRELGAHLTDSGMVKVTCRWVGGINAMSIPAALQRVGPGFRPGRRAIWEGDLAQDDWVCGQAGRWPLPMPKGQAGAG